MVLLGSIALVGAGGTRNTFFAMDRYFPKCCFPEESSLFCCSSSQNWDNFFFQNRVAVRDHCGNLESVSIFQKTEAKQKQPRP